MRGMRNVPAAPYRPLLPPKSNLGRERLSLYSWASSARRAVVLSRPTALRGALLPRSVGGAMPFSASSRASFTSAQASQQIDHSCWSSNLRFASSVSLRFFFCFAGGVVPVALSRFFWTKKNVPPNNRSKTPKTVSSGEKNGFFWSKFQPDVPTPRWGRMKK